MSPATGSGQSAQIGVFCTMSAKEALIELVPEFEHASSHRVNLTCGGGPEPVRRIHEGVRGNIVVGPEGYCARTVLREKGLEPA